MNKQENKYELLWKKLEQIAIEDEEDLYFKFANKMQMLEDDFHIDLEQGLYDKFVNNGKEKSKINNESVASSIDENAENISSSEKVKLFMSLFKGRSDVYAKRWISKTGKSGYSPVCGNFYIKYKCNKPQNPKFNCGECIHRNLMPLTEEVILEHLKGKIVVGIYPLLQGDSCNFLAIDFDDKTFEKDVSAFWEVCDEFKIPIYVEKSRSGNGIHVWIFFSEPIYAMQARKMGMILLTKTMEKSSLNLNSYDRMFPNQDTMPKGEFGNLIALPFQGESVKNGNTLFVDKYFEPYQNQSDILLNIKKINSVDVIDFINKNKEDDYENPILENVDENELPKKEKIKEPVFQNDVECIFDNQIYIKKLKLLPNEVTYLKRLASFMNPEYYEKQKYRLPIYKTPRIISCFEEDNKFLIMPRGCLEKIQTICDNSKVKLIIKDTREAGVVTNYKFKGKLRPIQKKALEELLKYDTGILSAVPSFGKTVVGIGIIDKLKTNTLIVVHTKQLLDQWKERLSIFLDIDKKEIGQIGGGKRNPNGQLDVGILQSLNKKGDIDEIVETYGLVIVDECHRISAFSFEQVLKSCRSKHVYGLTATPIRKDGHHKIVYMQCGDIRHRVTNRQIKGFKEIERTVITKKTPYRFQTFTESDTKITMTSIYNDMVHNVFRNNLIVEDIKNVVAEGKIPIVLSERKEHLNIIKEMLEDLDVPIIFYKAAMGKKETENIIKIKETADEKGIPRIILATSKLLGEGFDDARLDTLFLTMPVSWKGRITQYVGRLHREYDNKTKVEVYDYLDNMEMLEKMYEKRLKGYKSEGYIVNLKD